MNKQVRKQREDMAEGERLLRQVVPVFVNSFEQPTYLRKMLDWLHGNGFGRVIVLDQASTYPPLLDYYASEELRERAHLVRLEENVGPRAALDILPQWVKENGFYIFTDPDLDMPVCMAPDFLSRMIDLARRYNARKVGVALDISDPSAFHDRKVKFSRHRPAGRVEEWEGQFWEKAVEPDVYEAAIDTTFHLHNPTATLSFSQTLRKWRGKRHVYRELRVAGAGFVARHLPWYRDDGCPSEEKSYYLARASEWSNWVQA